MRRSELLTELAARICGVLRQHPVRVAVDGVDASGKTTLANELTQTLRAAGSTVIRASIDGFHHPAKLRHQRDDSAKGYFEDSFDYPALIRELLVPLGPGGSRLYCPVVIDYRIDAPVRRVMQAAPRDAVLLFDGVFLLRSVLRSHWDFSIFVEADFNITVARAVIRDQHLSGAPAAVRRRYEARYVPGQRRYLASEQPRSHASVVVVNHDPSNPVLEHAV